MKGYWHFVFVVSMISTTIVITEKYYLVLFPLLWLTYLLTTERLPKQPFIVSLSTLVFLILYIPTPASDLDPSKYNSSMQTTIMGKIVQPLEHSNNTVQFTMKELDTENTFSVVYFIEKAEQISREDIQSLKYGASCHLVGEINVPEVNTNPGEFNFQAYLYEQEIDAQFFLNTLEDINCQGASFFHYIYDLRYFLISHVSSTFSSDISAWIKALVLGDADPLPEEIVNLFQRWSLSHILAISGLHVGIIIGSIYFIFVRLDIFTKDTVEWIIISFLPLYALIAGSEPSVLRATLMITLFLLFNKFRANYRLSDTISLVCLLLIIMSPKVVYHLGFQFSFLVTFAIILSGKWLQRSTPFWQIAKISYIAQLVILPLQFIYFHTFQPLSILMNLLVVPYFSIIVIPLMFLLTVLSLFLPAIGHILIYIFEPFHQFILKILLVIDNFVNYYFVLGEFPLYMVILYYIALIISFQKLQQDQLIDAFKYSLMFVLVLVILWLRPYLSPEGSVTMLDIGQGDAFVIELPYRKAVIMVDASATISYDDFQAEDKNFEYIIKPYLYSRGIQSIDAIIISHEHVDHNGSVNYLVEEMDADHMFISNYYDINNNERIIWEKENVQVSRFGAGEQFKIKGQPFFVLSPETDQFDPDDNSLVLATSLGGKSWLFTGDISENMERKIIQQYPNLKIDVLKVAHHGSDTSSDELFINRIKPNYALISVGRNNQYNHPADEVIETLQAIRTKIYRTDEDGAVQYIFQGDDGTFSKTLPYNNKGY